MVTRLMLDPVVCYFRMTSNLDSYLHAHACDCLGLKCFICNEEAKDQIGIKDQFMADGYVVFTDSIDGSKWVFCTICKKPYHLKCVTCDTEQQIHAKGCHLPAHSMSVKVKQTKWVTLSTNNPGYPTSINWVTNQVSKRVTIFELYYCRKMAKTKFSKKEREARHCRPLRRRRK